MTPRNFPVLVLLALCVVACGPRLREAHEVTPEQLGGLCGVTASVEVTREQAICIAGLAGLNIDGGELVVRESGELGGGPTWVVEEVCDARNPQCIGVAIRRSDGTIADTRYLYAIKARTDRK